MKSFLVLSILAVAVAFGSVKPQAKEVRVSINNTTENIGTFEIVSDVQDEGPSGTINGNNVLTTSMKAAKIVTLTACVGGKNQTKKGIVEESTNSVTFNL